MRKKVLMIQPCDQNSFYSFHYLRTRFKKSWSMPLALATVAAFLPEKHFQLHFVDESLEKVNPDMEADLVMVSGFDSHLHRIIELGVHFRQRKIPTVVGGPVTFNFSQVLSKYFDHMVVGEGEDILPTFVDHLLAKKAEHIYQAGGHADMGNSKLPRVEIVDPSRYANVSIQTQRGCPFHCEFCSVTAMLGKKVRCKPISLVLQEIEQYHKYGVNKIYFADDNLVGKPAYAMELLKAIIGLRKKTGNQIVFKSQISTEAYKRPGLLNLMHQAGFNNVAIGFESSDPAVLQDIKKHHNLSGDAVECVKVFNSYGISVDSLLMVGFDEDRPNAFENMRNFSLELGTPFLILSKVMAMPNTVMTAKMEKEGRIIPQFDHSDNSTYKSSNIIHPKIPLLNLNKLYLDTLNQIYGPKDNFQRLIKTINQMKEKAPSIEHDWDFPFDAKIYLSFVILSLFNLLSFNRYKILGILKVWRLLPGLKNRRNRIVAMVTARLKLFYHFQQVLKRFRLFS